MDLHPSLSSFRYRSTPPRRSGWRGLRSIVIPAGIRDRNQLCVHYSRLLHFPGWFGANWDGLEEMLRDLSWLGPPRKVQIWHAGCPFLDSPSDLQTYCGILHDLASISVRGKIQYEVLFRNSDHEVMNQRLGSLSESSIHTLI